MESDWRFEDLMKTTVNQKRKLTINKELKEFNKIKSVVWYTGHYEDQDHSEYTTYD